MSVHTQPGDRGHRAAPGQLSTDSGQCDTGRLIGRGPECGTLDRLVEAVRAGESRVLVVHGEPGVGKTVLLDYLAGQARGCRVARAVGMQSEMALAFAGLHQLCAPMLDHAGGIPLPQQDALAVALGIAAGPPPSRFLVGLGVLSLLSEVARQRPVICLVDDEQWLDRASAQALGFTARRLGADPVGLVFAAREPDGELAGLPELEVGGLPDKNARALLNSALAGPLDARVRDLIVAETRGNPLALLELPRGLDPAELAGGFGLPGAAPLAGRIEESFLRQLGAVPDQTRRLVQLAAADPSGDRSLVWRAAGRLGIPVQAAAPAVDARLVEFGTGVRFRHPLVRSAAYWSAAPADRQQMHGALAEVTDPGADPDRRAWHRAQAAPGPDEEVAVELERSAGRAQARGGLAAAAAFLERSVLLTPNPARHVERILAAAQACLQAGAFCKALEVPSVVESIEPESLDELASARVDLLRGQIAFASSGGSDAPALLMKAVERRQSSDAALARQTYLETWAAALFAGRFAGAGGLDEVARAARSAPPHTGVPRPSDLLLDGLAVLVTEGRAEAAPLLRRAARVFAEDEIAAEEGLRWGWLATVAAATVWDEERWHTILARQLQSCRETGLLAPLRIYVNSMAQLMICRGDFAAAASLIAESEAIAAATGTRLAPYAALSPAGFRGAEAEAARPIEAVITAARAARQGLGIQAAQRAAAILYNGLGRYEEALAEAQQAAEEGPELFYLATRPATPGGSPPASLTRRCPRRCSAISSPARRTTATAASRSSPAKTGDDHETRTHLVKGDVMSNHFSAAYLKFPGDDARLDLTDLFVFSSAASPGRTALIMDVNPFMAGLGAVTPFLMKAEFHPHAVYRINVDNNGDNQADVAFTFVFSEPEDGTQTGTAYYATGAQARESGPAGDVLARGVPVGFSAAARPVEAGPVRLFLGVRRDPFFADAEGAFHGFQWTGEDAFADKNVQCMALEAPDGMLGADPTIAVWATVGVRRDCRLVQVDRGGHPTINPFINPEDAKDDFNTRHPADDAANYLEPWSRLLQKNGYSPEEATAAALTVLPDVLRYDRGQPAVYPNGRHPVDDAFMMRMNFLSNGQAGDSGLKPHDGLLAEFPYLEPPVPWGPPA